MTQEQLLMVAAMLWPLFVSAVTLAAGRSEDLRDRLMAVLSFGALPFVAGLWPAVSRGEVPELTLLAEPVPGVALAFHVEPLGLIYALVATSLWPITTLYAIGYMRGHHEAHQTRFYGWFHAAISAAVAVAFSANLLSLFVFYEALTLSTWPLVTHHQDARARRAGRIYLGLLMSTSVGLLLAAVAWTWAAAGTLDFRPGGILAGHVSDAALPVLLALFAFGTAKAGLMPVHRWLPNAMVAPTPVSALLHAVAVVKAGVFTILKVSVYVFGLDLLTTSGISRWLTAVAAFTILAGSLVAFSKDNLKERLAYSTISQLAYIVLAAAIATPDAIVGGALHVVTHAVGKITLFFGAGAIYVIAHETEVSRLSGLGRHMPLTFGAFTIGALSIAGLPPFAGSWSKLSIALGAAGSAWPEGPLLVGVLMLSSLLNIGYLLPVAAVGFFGPTPYVPHGHAATDDPSAPPHLPSEWAAPLAVAAPVVTAAGCVALFFLSEPFAALVRPLVGAP